MADDDSISVRRVHRADERMISECCALAAEFLGDATFLAGTIQCDVNISSNPMFVAQTPDNTVIGFVMSRNIKDATAEISALYVRGDMHRHGVGALLLRNIEKCLRDAGVGNVFLNARPWAVPFYRARGYVANHIQRNRLQKSL